MYLKDIKNTLIKLNTEFGTQFLKITTRDLDNIEDLIRSLKTMSNFGASGLVSSLESIVKNVRGYNT